MPQAESPLTRDQIAERLTAHLDELRSLGVRSLDLFGSIARGDAKPESDVDLLVEFREVPGFVGYVRLRNRLEEILGRRVDLVMASGLNFRIRETVLREARRVTSPQTIPCP
jgi:predicted nucleotidyltransferase